MTDTRGSVYHNLSVMIGSGLPLSKALKTGAKGVKGKFGEGLLHGAESVEGGNPLHEAMAGRPEAFPTLDVLLVKVGETSGTLAESLEGLSQWYTFKGRLQGIVVAGLTLPLVVFHVAVLLAPAPLLIIGNIGTAGYLLRVVVALAFLYVPGALVWAAFRRDPLGDPLRNTVDLWVMKIPVLGRGMRDLALSRFCRAFHMLYQAGGTPVEACTDLAVKAAGNLVVAGWLEGAVTAAKEGKPLSAGFFPPLPPEFIEVWRTGEETGTLAESSDRLADIFADRAEKAFVTFGRWFPRVLYMLVCLFMIVSIFKAASAIMIR